MVLLLFLALLCHLCACKCAATCSLFVDACEKFAHVCRCSGWPNAGPSLTGLTTRVPEGHCRQVSEEIQQLGAPASEWKLGRCKPLRSLQARRKRKTGCCQNTTSMVSRGGCRIQHAKTLLNGHNTRNSGTGGRAKLLLECWKPNSAERAANSGNPVQRGGWLNLRARRQAGLPCR